MVKIRNLKVNEIQSWNIPGIKSVADVENAKKVYNIGTGKNVSVADLRDKIKEALKLSQREVEKIKPIPNLNPFSKKTYPPGINMIEVNLTAEGKDSTHTDPLLYLHQKKDIIKQQIIDYVEAQGAAQIWLRMYATFRNEDTGEIKVFPFHTFNHIVAVKKIFGREKYYDGIVQKLIGNLELMLSDPQTYIVGVEGSNWKFVNVRGLSMAAIRHNYAVAAKYMEFPEGLKGVKGLVNVKNEDDKCFIWSILVELLYDEVTTNRHRVSQYKKFEDQLKMPDGCDFPMSMKHIEEFEELNKLKINVYEYVDGTVSIQHSSKQTNEEYPQIDLLLICGPEKEDGGYDAHYVLIHDFSAFMAHFNPVASSHKGKLFYCRNCLSYFYHDREIETHKELCLNNKSQRVVCLPEGLNKVEFKNNNYLIKCPFVIYCDFEALTTLVHGKEENELSEDNEECKTKQYQSHKIIAYGLKVVSTLPPDEIPKHIPLEYISKVGTGAPDEDLALEFLQKIDTISDDIYTFYKEYNKNKMIITKEQEEEHKKAKICHICKKPFVNGSKNYKVKDHDHQTKKYIGAAHNSCNLSRRERNIVNVMFHNFRGYDSHFIVQSLTKLKDVKIGKIIPINHEKFTSIPVNNFIFKDTLQFLGSSLEKIVELTPADKFKNLVDGFSNLQDVSILRRKGIFPYDWFNSVDKLDETKLPPIEDFYSELCEEGVSEENYAHAQNVWNKTGCKTFKDYLELYLKTDILLLADAMEFFRNVCIENYQLEPYHFFGLPGYSWGCMLRNRAISKEQPIETCSDINMQLLIEQNTRGGICSITKKYARANNKYMDTYDPTKPSSYIIYIDMNNLYGKAMSMMLPYKDYKWVSSEGYDEKSIMELPDEGEKGYLFEVDLSTPEHLHDLHNDYPFILQNTFGEESDYTKMNRKKHGLKYIQTQKLIGHFNPVKKHLVHFRFLKYMLKNGIKLEKIHRIIEFTQGFILKDYIEHNTNLRKKSKSNLEKDLYKLMNNSIYGKTVENVRKRQDIEIVAISNTKRFDKITRSHRVKSAVKINDETCTIAKEQKIIKLDKPVIVGFSVLELSKLLMFEFFYDKLKPQYGDKMKLLMTDTDSFILEIETEDIFKDMLQNKDDYDLSEMDKDHFAYDVTNAKVLGKMKSETGNKIIEEFCGIRAKVYSLKVQGKEDTKKCKGVGKKAVDKKLSHQDYLDAIFKNKTTDVGMNTIQSKKHAISSVHIEKTAICNLDDKRWVLEDGINTLAHGHRRISKDPERK